MHPAWLLGVVVVSGCGAAPASEGPTTRPSGSTAPSTAAQPPGLTLAEAGYVHAPEGFSIPGEVSITRRVDQPTVVTALFSAEDGAVVLDHLTRHLPAMGFSIDSQGGDSLLFSNDHWDGAFTLSPEISGLTLRRRTA